MSEDFYVGLGFSCTWWLILGGEGWTAPCRGGDLEVPDTWQYYWNCNHNRSLLHPPPQTTIRDCIVQPPTSCEAVAILSTLKSTYYRLSFCFGLLPLLRARLRGRLSWPVVLRCRAATLIPSASLTNRDVPDSSSALQSSLCSVVLPSSHRIRFAVCNFLRMLFMLMFAPRGTSTIWEPLATEIVAGHTARPSRGSL